MAISVQAVAPQMRLQDRAQAAQVCARLTASLKGLTRLCFV